MQEHTKIQRGTARGRTKQMCTNSTVRVDAGITRSPGEILLVCNDRWDDATTKLARGHQCRECAAWFLGHDTF